MEAITVSPCGIDVVITVSVFFENDPLIDIPPFGGGFWAVGWRVDFEISLAFTLSLGGFHMRVLSVLECWVVAVGRRRLGAVEWAWFPRRLGGREVLPLVGWFEILRRTDRWNEFPGQVSELVSGWISPTGAAIASLVGYLDQPASDTFINCALDESEIDAVSREPGICAAQETVFLASMGEVFKLQTIE